MFCISLNYKKADLAVRTQFAQSARNAAQTLRQNGVDAFVVLSTCNRFEVYGTDGSDAVLSLLFSDVKSLLMCFAGDSATQHLFKVTCGLDSMILGEDEILGQVKTAFRFALENGTTNFELNSSFQAAITAAKKIKTDTLLSKSAVSIPTLVTAACRKFQSGKKTVLVIGGSGDIGAKVLRNLQSFPEFELHATVRCHGVKQPLQRLPYAERYHAIQTADIVISATASPHFTVLADRLPPEKRQLLIDLAVPRDIDPAVIDLPNKQLLSLDDFQQAAKQHRKVKAQEIGTAQEMIADAIDTLTKDLLLHERLPLPFDEKMKSFIFSFRDHASAAEFRAFLAVLDRMEEHV